MITPIFEGLCRELGDPDAEVRALPAPTTNPQPAPEPGIGDQWVPPQSEAS